jgi:EF hand
MLGILRCACSSAHRAVGNSDGGRAYDNRSRPRGHLAFFFAQGDADKDGHWSNAEFFQHPGYAETGFDLRTKTFIFWMIDDNKDNRISLQEWFNNELGQFQLEDSNHDGVLSTAEATNLEKIEEKLFADLAAK